MSDREMSDREWHPGDGASWAEIPPSPAALEVSMSVCVDPPVVVRSLDDVGGVIAAFIRRHRIVRE